MGLDKSRKVYATFQSISRQYDRGNNRISLGQHWIWKNFLAHTALGHLPEGGRVLDLCCGTGDMCMLLARSRKDVEITGADFSPNMLKIAKKRLKMYPNIKLGRADARSLPFPDQTFDCALISFGLRNTSDYLEVLREMERVVKPSGLVGCLDAFYPENPLIRPFFRLYFKYLMPLMGGGSAKLREYGWLNRSTEEFVTKNELLELFRQAGLVNRKYKSFMFGACACHFGYKKRRKKGV